MKAIQASTTPAKKEAYMSMDRDERDILRTLGLRERALYPELKWLASFKTGEVKHFGKRVITFQFLADLITVPTTQGRAADTMNAKEACRVLMKLHDAGLVGEIENHPTKGLRFALPMSPICKKTALKLRHEAKAQEQSEPEKLPNEAPAETAENPIAMQAWEEGLSHHFCLIGHGLFKIAVAMKRLCHEPRHHLGHGHLRGLILQPRGVRDDSPEDSAQQSPSTIGPARLAQ